MSKEPSVLREPAAATGLPTRGREMSKVGLAGIWVFGGLSVGMMALTFPFVVPGFRRVVLPFVPATTVQIENVMQALRHRNGGLKGAKKLIDLGSGDGRIVIECAKQGIQSHGVELNLWLVLYSKFRSWRENVSSLTTFRKKNLFKVNLSDYNRIVIFGVHSLMPLIEEKVAADYANSDKSTNIVVCRFPFPNWAPIATFGSGVDQVWLYDYNDARPVKVQPWPPEMERRQAEEEQRAYRGVRFEQSGEQSTGRHDRAKVNPSQRK